MARTVFLSKRLLGAALHEMLGRVRLPGTFDVVFECPGLDPRGRPGETRDAVKARFAAGATIVNVAFRHDSTQDCVDQRAASRSCSPRRAGAEPCPAGLPGGGADEPVPGDEGGQLVFIHFVGALGRQRQYQVAGLGIGVPDPDLGAVGQLDPKLC